MTNMSSSLKRNKLSYIPTTDGDLAEMLAAIGISDTSELFKIIPEDYRLDKPLNLPSGLAEQDVVSLCVGMAARNKNLHELTCFLGAGAYDHYVPAIVDTMLSRGEFLTAYTPYQPEVAQGILQSIYEYQSLICALTQMDISNASLYDGGTAVGEAAIMSTSITGRSKVVVSRAVHPNYRQVLSTYTAGLDINIVEAPFKDGLTDISALISMLDDTVASVIVQYPNFFGCVEDLGAISEAAHAVGAKLIVSVDPVSLGLLTPPGAYGADIVVGEGQPLGVHTGFGGPYLGIFACRQEYVWKVPGRIVGATTDSEGRPCYCLTLQTREQHIRREKATSNICSNQALIALAATIYLSSLGKNGLKQVADLCFQKSHYAKERICNKAGFSSPWNAPFFKEFVVKCDKPIDEINKKLIDNNIIGGLDLGKFYPELENHMLLCTTEKRRKEQIDLLVELL